MTVMEARLQNENALRHSYLSQLGRRLLNERANLGISRKVLADETGLTERYIRYVEAGKGNLSIVYLRRIAFALHMTPEQFVQGLDEAAGLQNGADVFCETGTPDISWMQE